MVLVNFIRFSDEITANLLILALTVVDASFACCDRSHIRLKNVQIMNYCQSVYISEPERKNLKVLCRNCEAFVTISM